MENIIDKTIKSRAVTQDGINVFCAFDEIIDVTQLVENPRNPNTHPEEQIAMLAKIIRHNGWRAPITISRRSGFIVRGHARRLAAFKAGSKFVPVEYQDYDCEAAEYADLVADNRIAELAELNKDDLCSILEDLNFLGYDTELAGISNEYLYNLLANEETEEDSFDVAKALEQDAFVKAGDIWILGKHRLMCGDSTKAMDVTRLMDGKQANCLITDPPYNVNYTGGTGMTIANDKITKEQFYSFLLSAFKCANDSLVDGGVGYIFHSDSEKVAFYNATIASGFKYLSTCVWIKNALVLGRGDFQQRHEPVLYVYKNTGSHEFYGDRKQTTVWEFDRPTKSPLHPTMKPLQLIAYPMRLSSAPNGIVLDLFGGSGTTLIAAEQLGRICFTMELDIKYASAIVRRYATWHGNIDNVVCIRDGKEIRGQALYTPSAADHGFSDNDILHDVKSK